MAHIVNKLESWLCVHSSGIHNSKTIYRCYRLHVGDRHLAFSIVTLCSLGHIPWIGYNSLSAIRKEIEAQTTKIQKSYTEESYKGRFLFHNSSICNSEFPDNIENRRLYNERTNLIRMGYVSVFMQSTTKESCQNLRCSLVYLCTFLYLPGFYKFKRWS